MTYNLFRGTFRKKQEKIPTPKLQVATTPVSPVESVIAPLKTSQVNKTQQEDELAHINGGVSPRDNYWISNLSSDPEVDVQQENALALTDNISPNATSTPNSCHDYKSDLDDSKVDSNDDHEVDSNDSEVESVSGSPTVPWEKNFAFPKDIKNNYECKGLTLSKFDFDSLREDSTLTDTIIDAFLLLMEEEIGNKYAEIFTLPSQAILNTTYGVDSYVSTWAKSSIIFNDLWVVPSHDDANHWILFVVIMKENAIIVLNSLHSTVPNRRIKEYLKVLQFLLNASHQHCTQRALNWKEWKVIYPRDFPRQQNIFDCGVFVCLFIFSLLKGRKLDDRNLTDDILKVRQWLSCILLQHSEKKDARAPLMQEKPEMAGEFYSDARKAINEGTLVVRKPWTSIPDLNMQHECPKPTLDYLADIINNLFVATDKKCGAKSGCKVRGTNKMYQCALCREWLHMRCIGDERPRPASNQPYLCPLHQCGQTRTRNINKPARQRISIG